MHESYLGKKWPKNLLNLSDSEKLPKVNNRPRGKKSPNLVSLPAVNNIHETFQFCNFFAAKDRRDQIGRSFAIWATFQRPVL
jgi:hypothetical protein